MEENRFLSVRDGLERSVLVQQHTWLEETSLLEKTKQRARKIDLQHAANTRRAKAGFIKQYDHKLERLHKEQRTARSLLFMRVSSFVDLWLVEYARLCGLFAFMLCIDALGMERNTPSEPEYGHGTWACNAAT